MKIEIYGKKELITGVYFSGTFLEGIGQVMLHVGINTSERWMNFNPHRTSKSYQFIDQDLPSVQFWTEISDDDDNLAAVVGYLELPKEEDFKKKFVRMPYYNQEKDQISMIFMHRDLLLGPNVKPL